jgi:hypothetical protein
MPSSHALGLAHRDTRNGLPAFAGARRERSRSIPAASPVLPPPMRLADAIGFPSPEAAITVALAGSGPLGARLRPVLGIKQAVVRSLESFVDAVCCEPNGESSPDYRVVPPPKRRHPCAILRRDWRSDEVGYTEGLSPVARSPPLPSLDRGRWIRRDDGSRRCRPDSASPKPRGNPGDGFDFVRSDLRSTADRRTLVPDAGSISLLGSSLACCSAPARLPKQCIQSQRSVDGACPGSTRDGGRVGPLGRGPNRMPRRVGARPHSSSDREAGVGRVLRISRRHRIHALPASVAEKRTIPGRHHGRGSGTLPPLTGQRCRGRSGAPVMSPTRETPAAPLAGSRVVSSSLTGQRRFYHSRCLT